MIKVRGIGGGKSVQIKADISDDVVAQIASFMQTNGITTDAAKRTALNTQATLLALVKLFFSDAIQIVDNSTLQPDS